MRRAARSVLAGMAAAAGGAALLLLWSGDAAAEEVTSAPAEVVASAPTYNGQPLESMRTALETTAPGVLDVAAAPPVSAPATFSAASTAAGATFNGQPMEQVRSQFESPPVPVTPPPAQIDVNGGRHVIYSVSQNRVWLVEDDGRVSRTYLVSGKAGMPRPGEYRVYSKSAWTTSYSGGVRMRWMTRFAKGRGGGNIGFHEIPVNRKGQHIQPFSQLGTHRSSGCVRQHPDDALHMWNWAPVGTKVIVKA